MARGYEGLRGPGSGSAITRETAFETRLPYEAEISEPAPTPAGLQQGGE